jgi:hypothetical protein
MRQSPNALFKVFQDRGISAQKAVPWGLFATSEVSGRMIAYSVVTQKKLPTAGQPPRTRKHAAIVEDFASDMTS